MSTPNLSASRSDSMGGSVSSVGTAPQATLAVIAPVVRGQANRSSNYAKPFTIELQKIFLKAAQQYGLT